MTRNAILTTRIRGFYLMCLIFFLLQFFCCRVQNVYSCDFFIRLLNNHFSIGVCYPRFHYVWPIIQRLYTLYFHLLPYTARPNSGRQDRHRVQRLILFPTTRGAQKECEICRGRRVAGFTLLILITKPPEERKRKCTYVDSERGQRKSVLSRVEGMRQRRAITIGAKHPFRRPEDPKNTR